MASAKGELNADLANAKNRAKNAQSRLNQIVANNRQNNKPPRQGPEYDAQNQIFIDAGKEVARLTKAVAEFKEPEKVKTKSELKQEAEKLRQDDILAGRNPDVEAKRRADEKLAAQKREADAEAQKANPDVATEDFSKEFTQSLADSGRYIAGLSDPGRVQLAKSLNSVYGLKLPANGKYSKELKDAYVKALSDNYTRSVDFNQKMSLPEFLVTAANEGTYKPSGGDGRELPDATGSQYIYSKAVAAGTINDLYQSLLGRDATAKEINDRFKKLDKEQKDIKNIDKVTYKMVNGRQVAVRESRFDAKTFLTDLITGTDEYKNSKTAKETSKIQSGIQKLEQTAIDNGIKLSENQRSVFSDRLKLGEDITLMQQDLRKLVASTMPKNVQELMAAGNDLSDIYSPYRQAMSSLLEVPFDKINLTDPTLTGAINEKGNMPLYEFQRALRQDPRWQYTNNAREDVSSSVMKVLQDFGFQG